MSLIPWRSKREHKDVERVSASPLASLRGEIDRLFDRFFDDFWSDRGFLDRPFDFGFGPRTDLSESENEVAVKVELPGVSAKDVDISLEGNILNIRGEKKEEKEERKRDYYYTERQFGSFHRSIQLPSSVDPDKVEAKFKDGVLTVTVPKRADAKPKRIEVKTS